MCKKILLLLNIFAFLALLFPSQIYAQKFKEVDLERLLQSHPMMKNFDPTTRRFKGTDSEFKSVASLSAQLENNKAEVKQLNEEKKKIIKGSLTASSAQTITWGRIGDIDMRLKTLENNKNAYVDALSLEGKTSVSSILPVIQKILSEVLVKTDQDKKLIVLNKLPRFKTPIIKYDDNGLNAFFQNYDRLALMEYSKYSFCISCLFEHTDKTILFTQEDLQK